MVEGTWICMGGYGQFRGEWVDITMHTVSKQTSLKVLVWNNTCKPVLKNKPKKKIKHQKKATLIAQNKSKVWKSWSHFGISKYLNKIGPIGNFAWSCY